MLSLYMMMSNAKFFVENLLYLALPQIAIVGTVHLICQHRRAIFGTALALTVFLCLFLYWVRFYPDPSGLQIIFYVFALPVGGVGVVSAALLLRNYPAVCSISEYGGWLAFVFTAVGLLLGLLLIRSAL